MLKYGGASVCRHLGSCTRGMRSSFVKNVDVACNGNGQSLSVCECASFGCSSALPWFFFACFLAAPPFLAHFHVKRLEKRQRRTCVVRSSRFYGDGVYVAPGCTYTLHVEWNRCRMALSRQLRERLELPAIIEAPFWKIQQLVEQPYEAVLLIADGNVLGSRTAACVFVDVAHLLK